MEFMSTKWCVPEPVFMSSDAIVECIRHRRVIKRIKNQPFFCRGTALISGDIIPIEKSMSIKAPSGIDGNIGDELSCYEYTSVTEGLGRYMRLTVMRDDEDKMTYLVDKSRKIAYTYPYPEFKKTRHH